MHPLGNIQDLTLTPLSRPDPHSTPLSKPVSVFRLPEPPLWRMGDPESPTRLLEKMPVDLRPTGIEEDEGLYFRVLELVADCPVNEPGTSVVLRDVVARLELVAHWDKERRILVEQVLNS